MLMVVVVLVCVCSLAPAQEQKKVPNYLLQGALIGAAGGMAAGAGAGYGIRRAICADGPCITYVDVYIPSVLVGGAIGATLGALVGRQLNKNATIAIYPTVGIGTYGSAPGMIVEGHFR